MIVKVQMLSVNGCKDCKAAIEILEKASKKSGVEFKLEKLDIMDDAAINVAIEHNLESIPSFLIGKTGINGPYFDENKLTSILKNENNS